MIAFIRKHLILMSFFLFLFFCLFVGDGQQMLIDVVGAGGVLILTLIAFLYGKKERELPVFPLIIGSLTILYFCIRTIFSDDIGYSFYSTVRTIDVFLIFYLLYCYSTDEDRNVFPKFILGFCVVSLFVSCFYLFFPALVEILPQSNLLVPTYGHNNIVHILLFGIPIAVLFAIKTKKFFYFFISAFLFLGLLFSFARVGMVIVFLFYVVVLFFYWKQMSLKKRSVIFIGCFSITAMVSVLLLFPQRSYQMYFPENLLPKMMKHIDKTSNRLEYFRQAGEAIKERPLFGSGPGTFILQSKRLQSSPGSFSRHAHNVFLQELTEEGIIGMTLIVCLFMWWMVVCWCIYKKNNHEQRFFLFVLGIGLVLQTMNACMDFSLHFFIIQMLFIASMAFMIFPQGSKKNSFPASPLAVYVGIGIVFIFYVLTSLTSIGFGKRIPFFISYRFLSEFSSIEYLKNPNIPVSEKDRVLIKILHNKNPDVLSLLGTASLAEATRLFPMNFSMKKAYVSILIREKKYQEVGIRLKELCVASLKDEKQTSLKNVTCNIDFTTPLLWDAYEHVDTQILDKADGIDMALAKYFYFLGYDVLSKNPSLTVQLWRLAASFAPDWSYFWLELANLEHVVFHDEKIFDDIMHTCQMNEYAKRHCQSFSGETIPMPGYFFTAIQQI